jgi:hypothetical protein
MFYIGISPYKDITFVIIMEEVIFGNKMFMLEMKLKRCTMDESCPGIWKLYYETL